MKANCTINNILALLSNYKLAVVLTGFGLFFFNQLRSQAPAMRQYSVVDGLPSSNVYTAFEDSQGFMWFGTDKGLVRFDGRRFKNYDLTGINGSNEVWDMVEDRDGRIWFSTFDNFLYYDNETFRIISPSENAPKGVIRKHYLDNKGNHFTDFGQANSFFEVFYQDSVRKMNFPEKQKETPFNVSFIGSDKKNRRWFLKKSTQNMSFFFEENNQLTLFKAIEKIESGFRPYSPLLLNNNKTLILSNREAWLFDFEKLTPLSYAEIFGTDLILSERQVVNNVIFLNTNKGYKVLNKDLKVLEGFDFLNQMNINALTEDRNGNIWICTPSEGIYFLSQKAGNSLTVPILEKQSNSHISSLELDENGNIWTGLSNGNLLKTNKNWDTEVIKIHFERDLEVKGGRPINFLFFDAKGDLNLTYESGVFIKIPKERLPEKEHHFYRSTEFNRTASNFHSWYLLDESKELKGTMLGSIKYHFQYKNDIWIAASNGIFKLPAEAAVPAFEEISSKRTYALATSNDTLWIGRKDGLFFMNLSDTQSIEKRILNFDFQIADLKISKNGILWISAHNRGLFRYKNGIAETVWEARNENLVFSKLTLDAENQLWAASNKGIFKITPLTENPAQFDVRQYTLADGLPDGEVNQILVRDNQIYVATAKNITILQKENQETDSVVAPLYFTDFKINHQPTELKSNYELSYFQNNLTIEFACLSYQNPEGILYEYKTEGIDKDWQQTNEPQIHFNALPADDYLFRLRAVDLNGAVTEEIQLPISILPPWWHTIWAYLIYLTVISALVFWIYRLQLRRKLAVEETRRAKELDEWKNRLFSNITHEFRTPLTIISGITENMNLNGNSNTKLAVEMLRRNNSKLLNLVNQILDLTKVERGSLKTNLIQKDVVSYIRYILETFQPLAETKRIDLKFQAQPETIILDFDPEKLQIILFNLLSNALKMTWEGGEVFVKVSDTSKVSDTWHISVSDTGTGISKEELPHIFDRFYSGNPNQPKLHSVSTGIGLTLTKELVQLFNGTIRAESEIGKGSLFTLTFPKTNHAPLAESDILDKTLPQKTNALSKANLPTELKSKTNTRLPHLLIVEDNRDVINLLHSFLKSHYRLEYAANGHEGIEKALENIPDLILSDIIMPETDGFELCRTLKSDQRTSHIPIVLLTVKASSDSKLEGLAKGADAYVTKPFNQNELLIRLKKLHELRLNLQKRYSGNTADLSQSENEENTFRQEDQFILTLRTFIEKNIADPNLDVARICKEVGMSRTQLHKKITALTGASLTKFIRKIRLEKAEILLKESDLPVSEIAHLTGFESTYFTKIFKQSFGMTPRQYRKSLT